MRRMAVWGMSLAVGALLLAGSGCLRRTGEPTTPVATGAEPAAFGTHALPIYRLVANPLYIDTPSRLLVLQVRLESPDGTAYTFTPRELAVVLPDGSRARIFDRPRAFELLRRTIIAEADFAYLQRPDHPPGGIAPGSRAAIADLVASRLLADGLFDASQPLQGYVIVDVGAARTSLDGATVEVTATRMTDATPVRAAYRLAGTSATSEAP